VPDIIICAKFDVKKFRGSGYTEGQILWFPIEMAGHPYNSAALPHSLWYVLLSGIWWVCLIDGVCYTPFTRSSWLDELAILAGRASSMFARSCKRGIRQTYSIYYSLWFPGSKRCWWRVQAPQRNTLRLRHQKVCSCNYFPVRWRICMATIHQR